MIYCQVFLTLIANKSLKLSFALNCVLKCGNELKAFFFAFEVRQKFVAVPCEWKSQTRQAHRRDIINILLTSFSQFVM